MKSITYNEHTQQAKSDKGKVALTFVAVAFVVLNLIGIISVLSH